MSAGEVVIADAAGMGSIRGLADKFVWDNSCCASWLGSSVCLDCGKEIEPPDLDGYERDALLGWVRREMAREVARRRVIREATENQRRWCGFVPYADGDDTAARSLLAAGMLREEWLESEDESAEDREALAHHIAQLLGGPFTEDPHGQHGLAWTLCETAGWP